MTAPLKDFGRVLGSLFRFLKLASYSLIFLMAIFLAFRVAEIYRFFADLHPWAGIAFLAVFAVVFWLLIGRPAYRFLRMPVVIRPPPLPPANERMPRDLARHLVFVERYVKNLQKNPEWEGSPDDVASAIAECRTLREAAEAAALEEIDALGQRMRALETGTIARLLAPLDRKAAETIRAEALGVGVATAVSWNGTVDAFIVLWRNCNLVSRVARIYYGRPGTRGTLSILRDVSAATLAGAYMQDVSEAAGGAIGSVFGKTAGVLAGPLMDGGVNAIATLRIGYMAKARCCSFEAWTERTRLDAVRGALKEAGMFSAEVVREVVRTVGGGLFRLPGKVLGKMGDALSSLWKTLGDDAASEEPAGA